MLSYMNHNLNLTFLIEKDDIFEKLKPNNIVCENYASEYGSGSENNLILNIWFQTKKLPWILS